MPSLRSDLSLRAVVYMHLNYAHVAAAIIYTAGTAGDYRCHRSPGRAAIKEIRLLAGGNLFFTAAISSSDHQCAFILVRIIAPDESEALAVGGKTDRTGNLRQQLCLRPSKQRHLIKIV